MLSTVSNTAAPACSRTVSPRIRPSSRISSRSGRSLSSASTACGAGIAGSPFERFRTSSLFAAAESVPHRRAAVAVPVGSVLTRSAGKELGVQYYHLINDILLLARTLIGSVALGSSAHRDVCEL